MTKAQAGDYAAHFDPSKSNHREWLEALLDQLLKHEPDALKEGGKLRGLWTADAKGKVANPLVGVPYYSQRDSAQVRQRDRTCFSSSCAMLLEAVKPGTLKGANGDDQYLAVVQRFGDTTDPAAQIKALAHYGVTAERVMDAEFRLIERQIARGIPVPCGYLHRGHVDRPQGGGHWLTVYGHTSTHVIVHDPWGEPDLISGATLNANGKGLRFTRLNFGKRWMVETVGGGAYRFAPGKGWAMVVRSVR